MLRVGRQAGIRHPGHGRVITHGLCDGQAVRVVSRHTQRERAQSAQQQSHVERAEHRPGEQANIPDSVENLGRPGQYPGGHIGITIEVLGRAVPDQVDAEESATWTQSTGRS
jgi:hypothetical protein